MAFAYRGEQVDLGFGRGWLNRPAANSIRRIDAQIGHSLQITEAGRTWDQQNKHYQTYLRYGSPIALNPNTPSLHQVGNAVDSNEAQRIHAIMEDHGWRRTVYRMVNGVWTLVEPWHYEYFEQYDNHRNDPASGGAIPFPEEEMNKDQEATLNMIAKRLRGELPDVDMLQNLTALLTDVRDRIRGPLERDYDMLQSIEANAAEARIRLRGPVDRSWDMLQEIERLLNGRQPTELQLDGEDAKSIAASIIELLPSVVGTLSPETLAAVAKAAADETDRRNRERLGKTNP